MENKLKIFLGLLIIGFVAISIVNSNSVSSWSISICTKNPNVICVDMEESLPAYEGDALLAINGVNVVEIDYDERTTHIEYDRTIINLPPQEIAEYINTLEDIVTFNRQLQTIRPDLNPAPLCLLDINGIVTGYYSVNGVMVGFPGDSRCVFDCQVAGGCPE